MNVAFVKINLEQHRRASPPLGLLYLSAAVKSAGFHADVYHITPDQIEETVTKIADSNALWCGFSAFTGDRLTDCVRMSQLLDGHGVFVVWGNAHPTLMPEQVLEEPAIGAIALSEGEETAIDISEALKAGRRLDDIPGVVTRKANGEIVNNGFRPFMKNLDRFVPDYGAVKVEDYLVETMWSKRRLGIVASRGCPITCGFCYNQVFNLRRWRKHSPEFIQKLVGDLVRKYDIDSVDFLDDNMMVNKKWFFDLIQRIGVPWKGSTYLHHVTEEYVELFERTRCIEIFFGLESGNNRILKKVGKKITVEQMYEKVKLLTRVRGVQISGSAIFGYPGETREEFLDTIRFLVKLIRLAPRIEYTLGWFLPYPGTPMYPECLEKGFVPPSKTAGWDVLDRWVPTLEDIPWIEWATIEEFTTLRKYFQVACTLNQFNFPILTDRVLNILGSGTYWSKSSNRLVLDSLVKLRGFMLYGGGRPVTRQLKGWLRRRQAVNNPLPAPRPNLQPA